MNKEKKWMKLNNYNPVSAHPETHTDRRRQTHARTHPHNGLKKTVIDAKTARFHFSRKEIGPRGNQTEVTLCLLAYEALVLQAGSFDSAGFRALRMRKKINKNKK
jgi:hypothetical protein